MSVEPLVIILPGANGKAPGLDLFGEGVVGEAGRFELIRYPGWRRYVDDDFSANAMVSDLVAEIMAVAQRDPIHIVGISIGGHFGYAAALLLQESGRTIGGFCAVDTFMVASATPRPGWQRRAFSFGLHLLHKRRFYELTDFVRARFWRALLRLSGGYTPCLLSRSVWFRRLISIATLEPIFEEELSVRLLLRKVAPWIGAININSTPLRAPAVLIRTAETGHDDQAWQRRCPDIQILETPGTHQTMFEPENASAFRECFLAGTRTWRASPPAAIRPADALPKA